MAYKKIIKYNNKGKIHSKDGPAIFDDTVDGSFTRFVFLKNGKYLKSLPCVVEYRNENDWYLDWLSHSHTTKSEFSQIYYSSQGKYNISFNVESHKNSMNLSKPTSMRKDENNVYEINYRYFDKKRQSLTVIIGYENNIVIYGNEVGFPNNREEAEAKLKEVYGPISLDHFVQLKDYYESKINDWGIYAKSVFDKYKYGLK